MNTRWLLPAALFCACVVPVLAGIYRGSTIVLEGEWALAFAPGRVDRLPLFLHVLCSALYYPLSALQVLPRFRGRHPVWHRRAGKVAVVSGLAGALSSIWLSALHLEISGPTLLYGRLLFGTLWALFLVFGLLAIARKDFKSHAAWFVRAFAVAMPAGTLIFIVSPFWLVLGELPPVLDESIQSCAWIVHLGIAELLIRRRHNPATKVHHESTDPGRGPRTRPLTGTATASPSRQ